MSQSPSELGRPPAESNYRRYLSQLDRLIEDGESWSGNERNCAFLNLGNGASTNLSFAPVSSVVGLNFADDGRSSALVDWDFDGDLDIWTTNRTAPRVRFLQNDAPNKNHFIAFRLVGTECNRDAIGAVVEVELKNQLAGQKLVKTLRAGDGFLSQSSKWIHFGLGASNEISFVTVSWPNGAKQRFENLKPDAHYVLKENNRQVRQFTPQRSPFAKPESPHSLQEPESASRILLSNRIPLPDLSFTSLQGEPKSLNEFAGKPIWLSFWASWCAPCVHEMQEMSTRQIAIHAAGVEVLSLSLDDLDSNQSGTTFEDARKMLRKLNFPFSAGSVSPETVRRLEFIDSLAFGRTSALSLPTSFLISSDRKLAAIYRGPVEVDRVLRDAKSLSLPEMELLKIALPFEGVWFDGRRRFAPLAIVADLMDHSADLEAAKYLQEHEIELSPQRRFASVAGSLGTRLANDQKMVDALKMYTLALKVDPDNVPVLNNMAWHLAMNPSKSVRNPQQAVLHAERAAELTRMNSVPILDTLAGCYEANNETEKARDTLARAIEIARQTNDEKRLRKLETKLRRLTP